MSSANILTDRRRVEDEKKETKSFTGLQGQGSSGSEITSPVTVRFGLSGMGVAPAGVDKEKTGHHHLIVDVNLPDMDKPIPSDTNYRHFGGGQTEAVLELSPGKHTLQLLLGDFTHVPHSPPITSDQITITVK